MRLVDKAAIITGGGTGIGAAIARLFAQEGARVTITGRRQEPLDRIVRAIAEAGGQALAAPGSVTDEAAVRRAVAATVNAFGRIDVLVNNAGSLLSAGPLHEIPDEVWDETMEVFLKGVFRASRAVIPHMLRAGTGSIINISSGLGLKASAVLKSHAYAAAKAGVVMLTKTIAVEYAKKNVRCNCIAPAIVETPLTAARTSDAQMRAALERLHPMGRPGVPEDIARAAVYFASDESGWTTGTVLPIDGGWMAQ